MSDAEIGTAEGLEDLYLRHAGAGLRFAYYLTGDREQARDLVQDAFLRVAGHFGHRRWPDIFETYLRRTILNLNASRLRRLRVERRYLERERAAAATSHADPDHAGRETLWQEILRLPARQRAAIVLRYYDDLSQRESAEVLRCSVGALNQLVVRGMTSLRTRIREEGASQSRGGCAARRSDGRPSARAAGAPPASDHRGLERPGCRGARHGLGRRPPGAQLDRPGDPADRPSATSTPLDGSTSVVLATGSAGGERWELVAERRPDGLFLSLEAETFGAGVGFRPAEDELQLASHVFGQGEGREAVVFGTIPNEVVRVQTFTEVVDVLGMAQVLDVPDDIDASMNAFVLVVDEWADVGGEGLEIVAFDAEDYLVLAGVVPRGDLPPALSSPTMIQPGNPPEVLPEHGGSYWGVYLAVGDSPDDPDLQLAIRGATEIGYTPSIGDIACDQDAATDLEVDPNGTRVAVYFATVREAELAAENAVQALGLSWVGVARVTTYCLD